MMTVSQSPADIALTVGRHFADRFGDTYGECPAIAWAAMKMKAAAER